MKDLLLIFIITIVATSAIAAERKPIESVDIDEITTDTQVLPKGAGDNHLALAWWIPNEFWESILSRDTTTSEADKKSLLNVMSDYSLLAVVQADISSLGAFQFYTKKKIENGMFLSYTGINGINQKLLPIKEINPDLKVVLGTFKPVLSAAMGNLGSNMHFYVLNDKLKSSVRLMDPYSKGFINIQLTKQNDQLMMAKLETPLNSLFVPRKCPNGKDAHISWSYCPWSGKKLKQ